MLPVRYIEQTDPPLSPREALPTMYDLPSEDPEEPGLPDEFHDLQPELLRLTFRPPNYPPDRIFTGSDINVYYDVNHTNWYKKPDWFGVVGVSRLYAQKDLRLSYVTWQERVNPFVIVELLSPGTQKEDFGETSRDENQPPTKWEVYEQTLRVPYYLLFDRYTDQLRAFMIVGGNYQDLNLTEPKVWMPAIELGLGLWQGVYQGIDRLWLRWYDAEGNWIPTDVDQERQRADQESQRADQAEALLAQERQQKELLAARLRALGINPDDVINP